MYGGKSSNLEIEDTLRIKSILIPLLIISIATLSGIIYSNTAEAVQVERYWSVLEAYDHSSPNTDAEGFIGVKFREDFKQLVYNVNVNNIDNITGIYLYSRGNDNEEPRIILDLLKEAKEVRVKDIFKETSTLLGKKHEIEGTVSVGGVTSDDLRGDLKGKSLKDLHKLMVHGGTFIKILTKEFPRGEIGGSDFVPIDRFFPDTSDFRWKS
ncbi:MAG: CHRD domain-containing protein [Nitrososphaeraceae archaeon]|nr:CHRD domain-containing protein [Nitrososphaeraceae archaeon]